MRQLSQTQEMNRKEKKTNETKQEFEEMFAFISTND